MNGMELGAWGMGFKIFRIESVEEMDAEVGLRNAKFRFQVSGFRCQKTVIEELRI